MSRSHVRNAATAGAVAAGLLAAACGPGSSQAALPGAELYATCEPCHGASGEGKLEFHAPKIAGLPAWYLTATLQRYRGDLRGKHPDDAEGLRMRAMARQLLSDAEVEAVATHVSELPDVAVAPTLLDADLEAAEAEYSVCSVCHGEQGEGDESLQSPPVAGLNDWYLAAQLRKFKGGIRGTAEGDDAGQAMRAMTDGVDFEIIDDLAAYMHSLPR